MKSHIIAQAAEAIIYLEKNKIIKDRIKKSYRIPEIDEKLRKSRTKSETKLLTKASNIINCPIPLTNNPNKYQIIMPFIQGKKLSENLDNFPEKKQLKICEKIGESTAKLHDENIIHGDLTTSNMIFVENKLINKKINDNIINPPKKDLKLINKDISANENEQQIRGGGRVSDGLKENNFKIYFIDFGLSFISNRTEDKAVDLHLLKQALEAKHFQNWGKLFQAFLKGYSKSKNYKETLERLKKVEMRGRYKHCEDTKVSFA